MFIWVYLEPEWFAATGTFSMTIKLPDVLGWAVTQAIKVSGCPAQLHIRAGPLLHSGSDEAIPLVQGGLKAWTETGAVPATRSARKDDAAIVLSTLIIM